MNDYLTDKAVATHWWDMPAMCASGFLTLVSLYVFCTDYNVFESVYSFIAAAIVLWLMSMPLVRVLRRRRRQDSAAKLAKCFDRCGSSVTLAKLKRLTGIGERQLERLINQGYLQGVALDAAHGMVRLVKPETAPDDAPAPVMDTGVEAYNEKLRQIRDLNDRIDHREVSQKIDRIEALTGDIFRLIAKQPDRAAEARRFVSYYLPTTMKLLESYDMMEDQRYQGENITASRRQIEATLDTIIQAIERQEDRLFRADAMDVEAEIKVLETMMAVDGLSGQERGLRI